MKKKAGGKGYKYYQPNHKDTKDEYADCVIRSLTKATGKTWLEVFDELVPIAREIQTSLSSKPVYKEFLKRNGFIYKGISNKKGSKRPTVQDFSREYQGVAVLRVANHLVASEGGQYFDTWDCGGKSLYGYWYKKQ